MTVAEPYVAEPQVVRMYTHSLKSAEGRLPS